MSKQESDWCKKIEIWWLLRDIKEKGGYKHTTISWGTNGERGNIRCEVDLLSNEPYARFHYTQTSNYSGEKKDFDYKVSLVKTDCHFGGSRYWFKCGLYKNKVYCGRRVGVLYKDGDWFGCRHCYELTYSSRNTNRNYRYYPLLRIIELEAKAEKLEMRARNHTYRGMPTKKRRQLEKIYKEIAFYYPKIESYKTFKS